MRRYLISLLVAALVVGGFGVGIAFSGGSNTRSIGVSA
jgi:hypothetical protein